MSKNKGLKLLAISVISAVILILINSKSPAPTEDVNTNPNNLNEAISRQFNDNIRDVSARLLETEKKLTLMDQENKALHQQLKKPKTDVSDAFNEELEHLKEQFKQLTNSSTSSYAVNDESSSQTGKINDLDALISPVEAKEDSKELVHQSNSLKKTPFYTIPAGSDFSKVTLLSALIGEVPVEGKLAQPLFPFTAIVSPGEMMTANGMSLPADITGMKISGYSIGVGSFLDNISCVRAYVTSALFVFADGHFVSVGQEQMKNSAELVNNDSIGYLTNAFGNPCIKGQYITNAPRVLSTLMLTSGLQGAGNALSKWQMSYQAEGGSAITTPTGDMAHFAAGGALNEGSQKASDWVEKRIQGSFDMVFVPASYKTRSGFLPNQLSLHISQTISIDKEHKGRVLDYGHYQKPHYDTALR